MPADACLVTDSGMHQVLATRPDGKLESGNLHGAQSSYPFNREYMYGEKS